MAKNSELPKIDDPLTDSTLFDVVDAAQDKRGRIGRGIVLAMVAVFILAALGNVFAMETTSTSVSPSHTVSVTAPRISRAGMDAKITVKLDTPKKVSGPITLKLEQDYLDGFSAYDISPAPDLESSDGRMLVLEYAAPNESSFRLDIDGTVSEDSILQVAGNLRVYVENELVASTKLKLWKVY